MNCFSSWFRKSASTIFIIGLIIIVLIIIGCCPDTYTQPESKSGTSYMTEYGMLRNYPSDIEPNLFLIPNIVHASGTYKYKADGIHADDTTGYLTDDQVLNDTIPIDRTVRPLYGYWTATCVIDDAEVKVVFILKEDHTFSTAAALNGSIITKWNYGLYKLDVGNRSLLFLFDEIAGWKRASYTGTQFKYIDVVFTRQDTLPEWAE